MNTQTASQEEQNQEEEQPLPNPQHPRCPTHQKPQPTSNTPAGQDINISGVDFWHTVEFSRNGRSHQNRTNGFSGRSPFQHTNLTRIPLWLVSVPISEF